MPKVSDMLESKFLKQTDIGPGALLTVTTVAQYNVAKQGAEPEHKWCLTFREEDKPFVLNSTNIQLCKVIFESDDTDHWIGKRVVLYTDPTIMYQGKVTGGIRVRKPKASAPAPVQPPVQATTPTASEVFNANAVAAGDEDDLPF